MKSFTILCKQKTKRENGRRKELKWKRIKKRRELRTIEKEMLSQVKYYVFIRINKWILFRPFLEMTRNMAESELLCQWCGSGCWCVCWCVCVCVCVAFCPYTLSDTPLLCRFLVLTPAKIRTQRRSLLLYLQKVHSFQRLLVQRCSFSDLTNWLMSILKCIKNFKGKQIC